MLRIEHTKVERQLRGHLMSSFSIARMKTSYGVCEAGAMTLLKSNCRWYRQSIDWVGYDVTEISSE